MVKGVFLHMACLRHYMVGPWSYCTKSNKNTFEWVCPSKSYIKTFFEIAAKIHHIQSIWHNRVIKLALYSTLTTAWKVNGEDRFPLTSCLNSILFLWEKMGCFFGFFFFYHIMADSPIPIYPYINTNWIAKKQIATQTLHGEPQISFLSTHQSKGLERLENLKIDWGAASLILFKWCKITGLLKNNKRCFGKTLTFLTYSCTLAVKGMIKFPLYYIKWLDSCIHT